ncbi:MAG: hypothetical protein ACK5LK_03210 [Chthoniobacterales bacterium]
MQTHPFNIGQKPRQEDLWHWAERTQNSNKTAIPPVQTNKSSLLQRFYNFLRRIADH